MDQNDKNNKNRRGNRNSNLLGAGKLVAWALALTLIGNATLARSGASETGASLLIQLSNGLTLQMAVRDESVMACGTWSCPEFFESFAAAVQ